MAFVGFVGLSIVLTRNIDAAVVAGGTANKGDGKAGRDGIAGLAGNTLPLTFLDFGLDFLGFFYTFL